MVLNLVSVKAASVERSRLYCESQSNKFPSYTYSFSGFCSLENLDECKVEFLIQLSMEQIQGQDDMEEQDGFNCSHLKHFGSYIQKD